MSLSNNLNTKFNNVPSELTNRERIEQAKQVVSGLDGVIDNPEVDMLVVLAIGIIKVSMMDIIELAEELNKDEAA